MNVNDYYVAEYSHSQKEFHWDKLSASLERNKNSCLNGQKNDWIIIGIFKTIDEAITFNNEIKTKIKNVK